MSGKEVIEGFEFNPENDIYFTKPKLNKSGGKNVGVLNTRGKCPLFITTPLLLTWGINENDFEGSGKKTYDLSLQFPRDQDPNSSEQTKTLLDALQRFEEQIKNEAMENSKEWLGKAKMTRDVLDDKWTPMLKYPKDPATGEPDTTRAPTVRVKLPYYEDVFKLELYDTEQNILFPDHDNEQITPMSLIEKGQSIAVLIQNGGIWFANGKFGTTWKLVQAAVQPRASLYGKCHIRLSTQDKDKLKNEADAADENQDDDEAVVDDSDNEHDTEVSKPELAQDSPPPAPVDSDINVPVPPDPVKKRKPVKKRSDT